MASRCAPGQDPRAQGGLIVGSTATGVPLSFLDVRTNALTGAMVDIVRAVGEAAGLPVTLQPTAFAALIPSLNARKIDVIAAAMLRTPAREAVADFSAPVYAYGGAIAIAADDQRSYARLEDLRGRRIGAQVGGRFIEHLQAAGVSDVRTYDSLADIMRDLRFGRLDAAYADDPMVRYYLRVTRTDTLKLAADFKPLDLEDVCLVMRKNDPNLPRINTAIGAVKTTRIAKIIQQWGL